MIWNAAGELVLVRRGHPPKAGEWSIPGGKVEWGETLHQALLREVREETGLAIEIGPQIDTVDLLLRDAAGALTDHYVLIDFSARAVAGTLYAASDVSMALWVPHDALDAYPMWSETRRIIGLSAQQMGG